MKNLKSLIAVGFVFASSLSMAEVIATGWEAQQFYQELPGPVRGPYCTGACLPGHTCDSTCTSNKDGDGYYCSEIRHTRPRFTEYVCNTTDARD